MIKKAPWKSKTNWLQVSAVAAVFSYPEVRAVYCQYPEIAVTTLSLLTVAARCIRSNIGRKPKPGLKIIKRA
jgi:hypothetical protein